MGVVSFYQRFLWVFQKNGKIRSKQTLVFSECVYGLKIQHGIFFFGEGRGANFGSGVFLDAIL